MTFYDRYKNLCEERGIKPSAQDTVERFSATRATVTGWKKNNVPPRSNTVVLIADEFNVSTDYLLGRTDDRTDYTKYDPAISSSMKKAEREAWQRLVNTYRQLDDTDRLRVEAYIDGILTGDKYKKTELA